MSTALDASSELHEPRRPDTEDADDRSPLGGRVASLVLVGLN